MLPNPFASLFATALLLCYALCAVVVAGLAYRRLGRHEWTRPTTVRLGFLWLVLATCPYWAAGPWSFVRQSTDLDFALTQQVFLVKTFAGGQFTFALGGGTDVAAMSFLTGQLVSLERLLLATIPLWLAQGLHKGLAFGLGLVGSYLVCRRMAKLARPAAFGLAALYPVSEQSFTNITWGMGLGYALIPLAVYAVVGRLGRPYQWAWLLGVGILHAVSSAPTHTGLALFPAVLAAGVMAAPRRLPRVLGGLAVLALPMVLNWIESLAAKAQLAGLTYRAAHVDLTLSGPGQALAETVKALASFPEAVALGLAALVVAPAARRPAIAAGLAVAGLLGTLLMALPWARLGLGSLAAINFFYVTYAFAFIGLMAFAMAGGGGRRSSALVLGLAAGHLGWLLAYDGAVWLSEGGLATLERNVQRLEVRSWGRDEVVRVVSVPYRLPANIALVAGLDTADGGYNLILNRVGEFWLDHVARQFVEIAAGYIRLVPESWDLKCCPRYDAAAMFDADGLRILNVKYVLSVVPLAGLRQVDGPAEGEAVPPRSGQPMAERVAAYLRLIPQPPPLRVYALDQPLPRLFAATAVVRAAEGEALRRLALDRVAVTDQLPEGPLPAMAVDGFRLGRDEIEAAVTAPAGGVLVVNMPYTPFWSAEADGQPVAVAAANRVHTALRIPAGANRVVLRYHRPTVGERIMAWGAWR
jgi:hypothetical protein